MARRRHYIDLPDHQRRNFLKWTLGVGAALGLRPWKVFEINEDILGAAHAQSASCSPVNRFVGFNCGNGGFAWWTQLFPHTIQATRAGGPFYAIGQARDQMVEAGDHPMKVGPDAPQFGRWGMTAFMAGTNETHTGQPDSASTIDAATSMFAAVAALQTASPTLVPAIRIGNLPYGNANGAPMVASVPNADGMVDLFNSASSVAGAALANPADAAVFEAYFKANLSLREAARLPTMVRPYATGKVSANLLGRNMADQLRPTPDDLTRYGVVAGVPARIQAIGRALITAVKSFKLNLTSFVLAPWTADDPHGAFGGDPAPTVRQLGRILSEFWKDLEREPDPLCAGKKLADNVIIAANGDTPKSTMQPDGWPDGSPNNSNWLYVAGNGYLRRGWFGEINAQNQVVTWNPTTGQNVAGGQTGPLAGPAGAAVLYAVAKGDMRRVQDFYRGPSIDGVIIPRQQ
jgi:hypothetical protein